MDSLSLSYWMAAGNVSVIYKDLHNSMSCEFMGKNDIAHITIAHNNLSNLTSSDADLLHSDLVLFQMSNLFPDWKAVRPDAHNNNADLITQYKDRFIYNYTNESLTLLDSQLSNPRTISLRDQDLITQYQPNLNFTHESTNLTYTVPEAGYYCVKLRHRMDFAATLPAKVPNTIETDDVVNNGNFSMDPWYFRDTELLTYNETDQNYYWSNGTVEEGFQESYFANRSGFNPAIVLETAELRSQQLIQLIKTRTSIIMSCYLPMLLAMFMLWWWLDSICGKIHLSKVFKYFALAGCLQTVLFLADFGFIWCTINVIKQGTLISVSSMLILCSSVFVWIKTPLLNISLISPDTTLFIYYIDENPPRVRTPYIADVPGQETQYFEMKKGCIFPTFDFISDVGFFQWIVVLFMLTNNFQRMYIGEELITSGWSAEGYLFPPNGFNNPTESHGMMLGVLNGIYGVFIVGFIYREVSKSFKNSGPSETANRRFDVWFPWLYREKECIENSRKLRMWYVLCCFSYFIFGAIFTFIYNYYGGMLTAIEQEARLCGFTASVIYCSIDVFFWSWCLLMVFTLWGREVFVAVMDPKKLKLRQQK